MIERPGNDYWTRGDNDPDYDYDFFRNYFTLVR